jgi:hypothetical protein
MATAGASFASRGAHGHVDLDRTLHAVGELDDIAALTPRRFKTQSYWLKFSDGLRGTQFLKSHTLLA